MPTGIPGRRQMPHFELTDQEHDDLASSWSGSARSTRKAGRQIEAGEDPARNNGSALSKSGVAYWYFVCALALFLAQVAVRRAGRHRLCPAELPVRDVPFHILRMIHTNALIVWLLLGFFGATYYLLPEEASGTSTAASWPTCSSSSSSAAAVAVVGYLFRIHEGREFLEQPLRRQDCHRRRRADLPLQHQHDRPEGPQDGGIERAPTRLWGAGLFFLFAFKHRTTLSWTRCTGGGWSTFGSRGSGN